MIARCRDLRAFLLVVALWPAAARAQGAGEEPAIEQDGGLDGDTDGAGEASLPPDEARRHFESAMGLFAEGNAEAALAEFRASYALRPHPAVLYNIGLVQRSAHRYGAAIDTLRRYLAEAPAFDEPPERAAEVQQILDELESVMASLTVDVDEAGARVFVGGELVGTSPLGEQIRLEAGEHTVEVRLDGFQTFVDTVELHGREERSLGVDLRPLAPRLAWYQHWWLWTAVGVVVAGAVVAIAVPLAMTPDEADFGTVEIRTSATRP